MIGPLLQGSLALLSLTLTDVAGSVAPAKSLAVTTTEAPAGPAAPQARQLLALHADVVHLGGGRTATDGVVLIENGRVRAAGARVDVPAGTPTVRLAGHLAPGFVLPYSSLVPGGESHDPTRGFLPDARLVHGFRAASGRYADALAAGVTTVVLAPSDRNVVGGMTGVIKTAGGRVVQPSSHVALSMTNFAADDRRYPTSFSGIANELRRLFQGGQGVYGAARRGEVPVLIAVGDRHQVLRALDLGRELGLRGALVGAPLAGETLDALGGDVWPVVFATPGAGASSRVLDAMADFAKSGHAFGFAYDDPDQLRFTTAQLIKRGVSADAVLGALTTGGAAIAGVEQRVGRLERGFDADLVLWDGHPLELTSRPRAVYVDGRLVHGDPHAAPSGTDATRARR